MKLQSPGPRRIFPVYAGIAIVFLLALSPVLLEKAWALHPQAGGQAGAGRDASMHARSIVLNASGGAPQVIRVGVYVLSVGDLDMTTGSYKMDFFLNFKCDKPCDPSNFDLMNAESYVWEDQTGDPKNNTRFSYRVHANLLTELDLRHYPFDSHDLPVKIEDKRLPVSQLVYQVDPKLSGIDENVVVSGWLLAPNSSAEVVSHHYSIFDDDYSRYRFYVTIYHAWFSSFMKGFFAAIVIVLVGMLSFLMRYDEITERLTLTTSTLVGAILYHLTLTSAIPPVGYLTFADEFMIANYIVISAALAVTVVLMWYLNEENRHEKAQRLHRRTRWTIPGLWLLIMIMLPIIEFWPSIVKHFVP
jgi:hypothetical protein